MKKSLMLNKLALFVFSAGLSLGAFATTGEYAACVAACDQDFIACVDRGVGSAACSKAHTWCYEDCEGL